MFDVIFGRKEKHLALDSGLPGMAEVSRSSRRLFQIRHAVPLCTNGIEVSRNTHSTGQSASLFLQIIGPADCRLGTSPSEHYSEMRGLLFITSTSWHPTHYRIPPAEHKSLQLNPTFAFSHSWPLRMFSFSVWRSCH